MSAELALLFLRTVTQQEDAAGGPTSFDTSALRSLEQLHAEPGRFTCVLPVTPPVQNRYGTLHGGCIGELRLPTRRLLRGCGLWPLLPLALQAGRCRHPGLHPPQPARAAPCSSPLYAATLVDTVGSAALVTTSPRGGVSLNIK